MEKILNYVFHVLKYSTLNIYILQNEILINNDIVGQIMRTNILTTYIGIATRRILREKIFILKIQN